MNSVTLTIDGLRLVSEANAREHWAPKCVRKKKQRQATHLALLAKRHLVLALDPPYHVTITRVGKRTMDDDNLTGSAKAVRDEVALFLGINDGNEKAATWSVVQAKGKDYGVRITIAERR